MTAGIFTQNRYTDLHSHYRTHCGSVSPTKYRSQTLRTQKIEKKFRNRTLALPFGFGP